MMRSLFVLSFVAVQAASAQGSRDTITKSTLTSNHTIEWEDGNTYPVIDVEISSASHPFYTGKSRVVDTAGRVEQFRRRYGDNPSGKR